jgi:hypothetical protein
VPSRSLKIKLEPFNIQLVDPDSRYERGPQLEEWF